MFTTSKTGDSDFAGPSTVSNMTISIHVSRALCHLPLAMAPIDTGGYSAGDWNGRGSRCVRILRMKVLILLAEKGWFSMVFPPKVRLT